MNDDSAATALPDPDRFPAADVVIFDGECRFCRAQVERLHRWDGKNRLAFLPLQDARVQERYPDLSVERLMDEMVVVGRKGGRYGGAAALRYLSCRLPRLWCIAPLLHLPLSLPLWRRLYQFVARRRYRLWAKKDACQSGTCHLHDHSPIVKEP